MISIIMSVYNEKEEEVRQAIESMLNQTYKDFEFIIICDNPKNFKLKDILEEYAKKDDRVIVVLNKKNLGLSRSLNKGIKLSKYDYIARMDADDVSYLKRLEYQISYAKNNDADVIYSQFNYIDEQGGFLRESLPNPTTYTENSKILKKKNIIAHSSVIIKKSSLLSVRGYSEISVVEDYELWLRMIRRGFKFLGINMPLINIRIREDSMTTSDYHKTYLAVKFIKNFYKQNKNIKSFSCEEFEIYLTTQSESKEKYNIAAQKYNKLKGNWNVTGRIKYFQLVEILYKEPRIFEEVKNTYFANRIRKEANILE